jgi:transcriptional antiterminator NusG
MFQVLVPTEKVVTVKDGKKLIKDKVYSWYVMIEANLIGEIPHIIKGITSVIGLGETKAVSQFL